MAIVGSMEDFSVAGLGLARAKAAQFVWNDVAPNIDDQTSSTQASSTRKNEGRVAFMDDDVILHQPDGAALTALRPSHAGSNDGAPADRAPFAGSAAAPGNF